MDFLNKKQKIIFRLIGGIMILFIGYYITTKASTTDYSEFDDEEIGYNEIENNRDVEDVIENKTGNEKIKVHILGAVKEEGIIELNKESRIVDAIEEAGGTTENVDMSKINLAYEVKDGQKIYIPNIEENFEEEYISDDAGYGVLPEETENKKYEKVNINTAKQTELETLSGIGPSTALKIINYRNENGDFKTVEDLKNVPGIGDSKFESIKEDICV